MPLFSVFNLTVRTAHIIITCIGPSHYGQHVMGMLDCAPLIIVSDMCLTSPMAQWLGTGLVNQRSRVRFPGGRIFPSPFIILRRRSS